MRWHGGIGLTLALIVGFVAGCTAGDGRESDASATPAVATASLTAQPTTASAAPAPVATTPAPEWQPDPVDLATLPVADTWAIMPQAPADADPEAVPTGRLVVTPESGVALYDSPDHGTAFAVLPRVQYQGDSSYPIIAETREWAQVLISPRRGLPSQVGAEGVNGATGWVYKPQVEITQTDYLVVGDLATETLTVYRGLTPVFTTPMGVGKPATPTPVTRTFIMSTYHDPQVKYSDKIVALGTHSPTLDSYLGGPAPTAIHAYATYQGQISNGCLRVPAENLAQFSDLPLGTPVVIWATAPAWATSAAFANPPGIPPTIAAA